MREGRGEVVGLVSLGTDFILVLVWILAAAYLPLVIIFAGVAQKMAANSR